MDIKVSLPNIRKATVEVKIVTLAGKEMTLAIFRQLPDRSVFRLGNREDGENPFGVYIRGDVWGIIRYHFDGCEKGGLHVHYIWQLDDKLYRGVAYESPMGQYPPANAWPIFAEREHNVRLAKAWRAMYRTVAEMDQLFIGG